MLTEALTLPSFCQRHHQPEHPWDLNENVTTLKVCIISISVLIISVGKLGVLLAVWDSSERRVVVETRVKDLVDYFLRLLSANFPHGQDGAKGAAADALLMMLLQAKVESCDFIAKGTVSTEVSCPNLRTSQVSEVAEPVHMGPAVVKGVDELMRDHSVHMGLLVDVVLTQNDLRRSSIKATADCAVTIFTGEMSVFQHFAS